MKKVTAFLLSVIMLLCMGTLGACASENGDNDPVKKGIGYTNERDKYFYGIQESMQESFTQDPMSDPEMTATLAGTMGFSSYRFRMEVTEVLTCNAQNVISFMPSRVTEFHGYLDMLAENGITNIMAQSAWFLLPRNQPNGSDILFPRPGTLDYDTFMNMVEESYYMLAKEFKEIRYWQPGNEMNADHFCSPTEGLAFTQTEKAQIVTDLSYYANRGMKRGNPDCGSVMQGPATNRNPLGFMQQIYNNIQSGDYPSTGEYCSTDSDDYFDVIGYHPYNFSSSGDTGEDSLFINQLKAMYDIVKENGDDGKKVFFDEYGFTTTWKVGVTPEEMETQQKDLLVQALKDIYAYLPFVETVHIFRMFDWEEASYKLSDGEVMEVGFGLFTSPGINASSPGPRPKKNCIELYKFLNGDDADLSPLYAYYKGE